jgi:hypothetical protein
VKWYQGEGWDGRDTRADALAADDFARARECARDDGWREDTTNTSWGIVVQEVREVARGPAPPCGCGAGIGEACVEDCDARDGGYFDEYIEYALDDSPDLVGEIVSVLETRPAVAVEVMMSLATMYPAAAALVAHLAGASRVGPPK